MPSQEYNLIHVLRILTRWKKHILILTVAAAFFTAVFSWFFLDDYYLSYTTVYPINMSYTDRSIMFNTTGAANVPYYGDKEDVSRVLSIANSAEVAQYIIEKYDLPKVYDIDTTEKYWRTKVQKEFESNYKAIKTERGAVEISILDTDPNRAKEIIDDVTEKVDETNRKTINESKQKQYDLFVEQIGKQKSGVESIADTMAFLAKKHNIVARSAGGAEMIEGNDPVAVQQYKVFAGLQKEAISRLNNSLEIQEQIKASIEANSSSLSVIDKPFVADRKEKPKRSIIVLLATVLALAAGMFGALAVEEIKQIREQI